MNFKRWATAVVLAVFVVGTAHAQSVPVRLKTPSDIKQYLEGSWFYVTKQVFPGHGEVTLENIVTYKADNSFVLTVTDAATGKSKSQTGMYQVRPLNAARFGLAHQFPGRPARPATMEVVTTDSIRNVGLKFVAQRMPQAAQ